MFEDYFLYFKIYVEPHTFFVNALIDVYDNCQKRKQKIYPT